MTENLVTWGDFEVRLDQELGRGGMGIVYRARQISLDRPVAVKVLDPSRADTPEILEGFLERFRIEARAVAKLRDPRVVSVIQAGRNEGRCWIAMELIEGKTVEQRLAEGRFEDREIVRVAGEVALALEAARRAGILHRDVKPANVFLCADGAVKLGDWGLARAAEFGRTKLSDTNAVTCTPAYVAPELIRGGPVDFRADLYSLGCVLYEMATERPPFQCDSPVELLYKHGHEQPMAPSRLNPSLGKALESVIVRCLAKDPDRRFASYDELVASLDAAIAPAPARSRSRLVWITAALGAVLVAGFHLSRPRGTPRPEAVRAELPRTRFVPPVPRAIPEPVARPRVSWPRPRAEEEPSEEEMRFIRRMWSVQEQGVEALEELASERLTPYVARIVRAEIDRQRSGRPPAEVVSLREPRPEIYPHLPGLVRAICLAPASGRAVWEELVRLRDRYPAVLRYAFEPAEFELRAAEALERKDYATVLAEFAKSRSFAVAAQGLLAEFRTGLAHELVGDEALLGWEREGDVRVESGAFALPPGAWIVRRFAGARRGYEVRFRDGALCAALSSSRWLDVSADSAALFKIEDGKPSLVARNEAVGGTVAVVPAGTRIAIFVGGHLLWCLDAKEYGLDEGVKLGSARGAVVIESVRVREKD